jgi:hypothetical protein
MFHHLLSEVLYHELGPFILSTRTFSIFRLLTIVYPFIVGVQVMVAPDHKRHHTLSKNPLGERSAETSI